MDVLYLKAIVSGICFGLWPLFMNKSGLNSAEASAALSLFLLAVVSPFLLVNGIPQFLRSQMADGRSRLRVRCARPACAKQPSRERIERTGGKRVRYSDRGAGRHSGRVFGRVGRRIDAKVCDRFGRRSSSSIPAPLTLDALRRASKPCVELSAPSA